MAQISTNLAFGAMFPAWAPSEPSAEGCKAVRSVLGHALLYATQEFLPELIFTIRPDNLDRPYPLAVRLRGRNVPITTNIGAIYAVKGVGTGRLSASTYSLNLLDLQTN